MESLAGSSILLLVVVVAAAVAMSRFMSGPKMICTRCKGTGTVDERWPDPSQPGGWHRLEGRCPKCKGKGKV